MGVMERTQFIRNWICMFERAWRDKWAWSAAFLLVAGLAAADAFISLRALNAGDFSDSAWSAYMNALTFIHPHAHEISENLELYLAGVALVLAFVFNFIPNKAETPLPFGFIRGALILIIAGCWMQFVILDNSFDDWEYFACFLAFFVIMYLRKEKHHAI